MLELPLIAYELNKRDLETVIVIRVCGLALNSFYRAVVAYKRMQHVTLLEWFIADAIYTCVAFTYALQSHGRI